jgi:mRNA interferase MazF
MATARHTRRENKDYPRRGEIYLTAFDPTVGREIQKPRACLIVQADVLNRLSDITIIVPITSTVRFPLSPVHVLLASNGITGLAVTSVAVVDQIRAVDRARLVKRLGRVDDETTEQVDLAVKISLGLMAI